MLRWANSRALELAGITRKTRNPRSGIVVKDRRTGEPTGVLKDDAVDLVSRLVPEPTHAEKLAALRAAIGEANRLGITSVHSISPTQDELQLLDEIRKDGDLGVRVYASIVGAAGDYRSRHPRAEQAARRVSRRSRVEARRRRDDVPVRGAANRRAPSRCSTSTTGM